MKRILVVQSRSPERGIEREQQNFRHAVGKAVDLEFLSALDERLAWTSPDEFLEDCAGAIFGGSDYYLHGGRDDEDPARLMSAVILNRVLSILKYAAEEDIPILGVCFGHQLIA